MIIKNKKLIIFLVMLSQTMFSISIGFLVLYYVGKDHFFPNIYVGNNYIKEKSVDKFVTEIVCDLYKNNLNNNVLIIKYNNKRFNIKFTDIEAKIDYMATDNKILAYKNDGSLKKMITGYISLKKIYLKPVVSINENKLSLKLGELSKLIDILPVNADISINGSSLIKYPEAIGVKLNIENSIKKVKSEIEGNINSTVEFNASNCFELEPIYPMITSKYLEDINCVLSKYSTDIKNNNESIELAAKAINKVLIDSYNPLENRVFGAFSFNKYLNLVYGIDDKKDEGYNQVVSTLYSALLNSGINRQNIFKTAHNINVDYIDADKAVLVLGNDIDFRFYNTLSYPIMIFSYIDNNKLNVCIAGKK